MQLCKGRFFLTGRNITPFVTGSTQIIQLGFCISVLPFFF